MNQNNNQNLIYFAEIEFVVVESKAIYLIS